MLMQEKEVWVEEDKMEEEEFDISKYFTLHDVDRDGEWNRQVRFALTPLPPPHFPPYLSRDPFQFQSPIPRVGEWNVYHVFHWLKYLLNK
jgi:hypothetical protein